MVWCAVLWCDVLWCAVLPQEPIKPHEVKVLNFLAHEYLLQRGNRMTAITLCEENSDQVREQIASQGRGSSSLLPPGSHFPSPSPPPLYLQDFDDWGDVGLNIPKPPGLLQLFRNYHKMTEDRGEYVEQLQRKLSSQTSQILALQRENETLSGKVRNLER